MEYFNNCRNVLIVLLQIITHDEGISVPH